MKVTQPSAQEAEIVCCVPRTVLTRRNVARLPEINASAFREHENVPGNPERN